MCCELSGGGCIVVLVSCVSVRLLVTLDRSAHELLVEAAATRVSRKGSRCSLGGGSIEQNVD